MTPYHVSPAADADLDEQAAYLAGEASLETALRFYDAAAATFEAIARMPGIGQRHETSNLRLAGLRAWRVEGFENHLVFYRLTEAGVEVVRVLHGARDLSRLFEAGDP
jgi:toxin ParE1/3/4